MAQQITATNMRAINEGASVIDIHGGVVTARSEQPFMDAYARDQAAERLVIPNFTRPDDASSGGIGLLVTMLVRANRQTQKLSVLGLNEHYRQIFELTRLDEAIGIYDDEASAVAGAKPS